MTELFKIPAVVLTVLGFELLVLMIYRVYQMYIEMIFVLGIEMVRCSYPAVKDTVIFFIGQLADFLDRSETRF